MALIAGRSAGDFECVRMPPFAMRVAGEQGAGKSSNISMNVKKKKHV